MITTMTTPKIGDTLFLVPREDWGHLMPDEAVECQVSEVDTKNFYAHGMAFEIDSHDEGSWYNGGCVENEDIPFSEWDAFVSRDAFEKMMLKEIRVHEIQDVEFMALPCDKIEAIYHAIFGTEEPARVKTS